MHELVFPASDDLFNSLDGDLATWLNDLLDGPAAPAQIDDEQLVDLAELDRKVANLTTRIQIACQDTASQLEQAMDDISRTVPRLSYDLQFMRECASSLQTGLNSIHAQSIHTAADPETLQALQRLEFLDTVKTRMESTREVLREAESWSTLEAEVIALIAENTYDKAAERLAEANKSMVVFQNTPEYESRRALMVSLQNQLEASLSSSLVAAINSRDVPTCRTYHIIFTNIQRESEFRNYYYGSRRATILALWNEARLIGEQDDASLKFTDLLSQFFRELLVIIHDERRYTPAIFPEPQQALSTFIQSTLDALSPSFAQRLSSMSEFYGPSFLPELIQAFRTTQEFAISTDKIIEKLGFASLASPATPLDDKSKRLSKRMSLSRRLGAHRSSLSIANVLSSSVLMWEQALFEPFIDFQSDYSSLERKYLDDGLRQTVSSSKNNSSSNAEWRARVLRERSVDVFTLAEEALGRCLGFTHGYGAVGLLNSIDYLFDSFLSLARTELLSSSPISSSSSKDVGAAPPGDGFEQLDYTTEDWTSFQLSLHLLSACRSIRERLMVLEGKLKSSLVHIWHTFQLSRGDPNGMYLSNTTRGEAQLLSQSSLNSAELHTLLDSLDTSDSLLRKSRAAITDFTSACQRHLQSTILSPLHKHLLHYASSPLWSPSTDASKKSAFELQMPTFSLSPSQSIQRVAEGLLNLPRMIEVYAADDDALGFSIETLPFVDSDTLRSFLEPTPEDQQSPPSRRAALPPMTPEMVSSTWLSSLALSLLCHLTTTILPQIRSLSDTGAAQLSSDLEYLSNIVRSFNVEWEDLDKWKEYVDLTEEDGKNKMSSEKDLDETFKQMARIRGWK